MSSPETAVAAATHPDPYPHYVALSRERAFGWDDSLGMWVAASADATATVLTSPCYRVRPADEPVPAALSGTPAGAIFGRLVRMTDGDAHAPLKQAVSTALATVGRRGVDALAATWATALWERHEALTTPARVTAMADDLSPHVVGNLLGLPPARLAEAAARTGDLVRCLSPISTPEQLADGIAAAERLAELLTWFAYEQGEPSAGLLAALRREIERAGIDDRAVVVANAVGLLSQAYEATAGLIGNALLAFAAEPRPPDVTTAHPRWADRLVRETLRRDPPIQSTRRYAGHTGEIAGRHVRAGDPILVLLAAANHDPAHDSDHQDGPRFSLGAGAHACPGGEIALAVAAAAVRQVVVAGVSLSELAGSYAYRPSANARIPRFGERGVAT